MRRGDLWLEPAAAQRRFGIKGPRAAELLGRLGFRVPGEANSWAPLRAQHGDDTPDVIARLGASEFFIEESGDAPGIELLEREVSVGLPGIYPVLREDVALVLGGARASHALAEVCNIDFAAPAHLPGDARKPVFMTLMTGVGVLVLPQLESGGIVYRIWCDPSFGPYLWDTLAYITGASVTRTTTGSTQ